MGEGGGGCKFESKLGPKFGFSMYHWNDTLEQCLATSRGKIHKKCFWELAIFCHFLKFVLLCFPLNCTG